MGHEQGPQAAYVYDLDEFGKAVRGTKKSASTKEKPNVSHRDTRPSKPRKAQSEGGPVQKVYEPISPGTRRIEVVTDVERKVERRKSSDSSNKSIKKSASRPPSAHENRGFSKSSLPPKDDPSHFGIPGSTSRSTPVLAQPIPHRPRATTTQTYPTRPLSYHAAYTTAGYATGPPISASAYYQQPVLMPPSYPPPSPSYMRYAVTPQVQTDYFGVQNTAARSLATRFDPIQRTSSAYGVRDGIQQALLDSYDDGYASASEGPLVRRASIRGPPVRTKAEVDYEAMPPPRRPGILRRPVTEYHANIRDPPYEGVYREGRSVYRDDPAPRRPSLRRNSVSYDVGPEPERVRVIETANNSRRRQSYYGQSNSTGSSGYEDKVRNATTYQEDIAGGPSIPLTAEVLKRQQRRHAGSSRSTKSSGSRDESDYRKSATTRTTRSGSGQDDENVTIKVTGQARVMVGGAQIDCTEGGEIEIKHQKAIRGGSERSNSEYGGGMRRIDDRRSRVDRPSGRSRVNSQHSYIRSSPQYSVGNFI